MAPSPSLYLIPNFIGSAPVDSVFPAANISIISKLKFFLAETPKEARKLIKKTCPECVVQDLSIERLDKTTTDSEIKELLQPLLSGHSMGIISDAGCPAVADPGSLAALFAHQSGIAVRPLVGPCSMLLALMASGLYGQHWRFQGYIPVEKQARLECLTNLERQSGQRQETQIFMETPYRTKKLFEEVLSVCQPGTFLCVAQDVTTPAESIQTMRVADWRQRDVEIKKAPTVFLIASGLL